MAPLSSGVLLPLLWPCLSVVWPDTPQPLVHNGYGLYTYKVWALPRSLAATWEIDVSFSSSGY